MLRLRSHKNTQTWLENTSARTGRIWEYVKLIMNDAGQIMKNNKYTETKTRQVISGCIHKTLFQNFCGSSLYFFANCNLAFWFLLQMVWILWYSLYIAALFWTNNWDVNWVNWDTISTGQGWRHVMSQNKFFWGGFIHNYSFSSLSVSVINCCCFPWPNCLMSVAQYTSVLFIFHDIPNYSPLF